MADLRRDKHAVAEYLDEYLQSEGGLPAIKWYGEIASNIGDLYTKYSYVKGYEKLVDLATEGGNDCLRCGAFQKLDLLSPS